MNDKLVPYGNDDMLPVGMLANGSGIFKAMENVAVRKNNIDGWQPFYYEKISATEFEVTGGIPAIIDNAKKWPESHTTVIVSEEELAQELAETSGNRTLDTNDNVEPVIGADEAQSMLFAADGTGIEMGGSSPKYMTVILRMPTDAIGHQRITEVLALNKNFFGAVIIATAFQDDILVGKFLQNN
ncbi:MAG: hypothetical protein H7240_13175 [Glaciimonas sp.]|nr:hypothetical protein [Glaciimonas sp.]